jgi:hypothetical protein
MQPVHGPAGVGETLEQAGGGLQKDRAGFGIGGGALGVVHMAGEAGMAESPFSSRV